MTNLNKRNRLYRTMTKKQIYKKLKKSGLTYQQIGDKFHISRQAVYGSISYKCTSNKHGDFKYGIRIGSGGRDYWKEIARIRDNHTCQTCGKHWKEGQKKFDVAHLKEKNTRKYYSKKDLDNLVTLCHRCLYKF